MIKIALIGIVGILLALQIKAVKPEYAVYLCMGVSLLIFMGVTEQLPDHCGCHTGHRNLPAVRPEVYKNSSENRGDYLYCGIFLGSL